ncbi:MAG: hypothetical protein PWQ07_850 [Kosmotoga sp.]|nr:hypothetical protein [Kosmotoga sp.]
MVQRRVDSLKFVGIDAGGTKTLAAMCNEKGEVLAVGRGGPGNHLAVGIDRMLESIHNALKNASIAEEEFDVAVLGLAGLGFSKEASHKLEKEVRKVLRAKKLEVFNDCLIALKGAIGRRKRGMIAVAGTGSMVIGTNENSEIFKVGGWGHLLGDEGSAYKLSFDAIRSVMKYWENRGEKSKLAEEVSEFFGVNSVGDVIRLFYIDSPTKERIALFAPRFIKAAEEGDRVALKILNANISELTEGVKALSSRIGSKYISYSGGMFSAPFYKDTFKSILKEHGFELKEKVLSPVGGALLIALEVTFESVDEKVIKNLKGAL